MKDLKVVELSRADSEQSLGAFTRMFYVFVQSKLGRVNIVSVAFVM